LGVVLVLLLLDRGDTRLTFAGHFVNDAFAIFFKILIALGAAGVLLVSPGWLRREGIERFEYVVLALFSTLGMMMMVSANSLLALYLALELQSLPLYVLAAFQRDSARASEAGLKYFVLGALASGLLLYGCSLVYGFTGTVSFDVLRTVFEPAVEGGAAAVSTGAVVGLVFVTAGLAFKLAAVPFHMWTPDVYEGAPTPVTAFIAAAPKVAALGLTLRVFVEPFGAWVGEWQQLIVFVSIASMLLGAFAALMQTNIKRLLAYSSIGHMGYALVGLAAGTPGGVYGVLVYAAIYLTMTVGTFGCILALRRQGRPVEDIADFAGLATHQPLLAFGIAVFMFSLAGIPPLAGFFAKFYVFMAAVQAGLVPLAVIGLLASVVGAYYYLRIVKLIYFDEPAEAYDVPIGREIGWVVGATAAFNLFFVLYPGPLLGPAEAAVAALLP
ncbi:MAG TPA: NADH-quinone oxidoreductase subunit NuoN, partial [Geminicoccaceae bacterium]|nr:NADH-quinone oxidoreductase subunit NuoN [Geminicoccaceae bacterium]